MDILLEEFSKQYLIVRGIPVGTSHQVFSGPLSPNIASFRIDNVSFSPCNFYNTFLETLWNSQYHDLAHMGKNLKFFTAPFGSFANLNFAKCIIKGKNYNSSSWIFSFTILFVLRQPRVGVRRLCELYINWYVSDWLIWTMIAYLVLLCIPTMCKAILFWAKH